MKNRLALVLVVAMGLAGAGWGQNQDPEHSQWKTSQENPGQFANPENVKPALSGKVWLGHTKKAPEQDGNPKSWVEKEFNCAEGVAAGSGGDYCTVTVQLFWYRGDSERLKLTLTRPGIPMIQKSTSVYMNPNTASAKPSGGTHSGEYTISVKGCKGVKLHVQLEETAASKKPGLQSFAQVEIIRHKCTKDDETAKSGHFVDEHDKPITKPQ